jgi:uncharacterized protein YjbI with pentapeptide repeats
MTDSKFSNSDLRGAVFENTNPDKADFLTSSGYTPDQGRNRLNRTKFSRSSLPVLLNRFDILVEYFTHQF